MGQIIWITGTDTGVGKTVVTALLLSHLRQNGVNALAMKPFACGSREDVELFDALQEAALPPKLLNPFFFARPLAPLVAADCEGRRISIAMIVRKIKDASMLCEVLLVEGCGGLMAPLGRGFDLLTLIKQIRGRSLVVAEDRLGVLNQVLLVQKALASIGEAAWSVVLSDLGQADRSRFSNGKVLRQITGNERVVSIAKITSTLLNPHSLPRCAKKLEKKLAVILESDNYVLTSARCRG